MALYGDQQEVEWAHDSESMRGMSLWEREVYPERPGQPDCSYYVRTGSCGYGAKCRYNHPLDRSSSVGDVVQLGVGDYPERLGEPACQFYLRTGTCKFASSCKFNHPKNAAASLTNAPLNIYGYPLRPGEKECSYYLKAGQCKFGITCKFDHPQTSVSATARPFYPTVQSISSPSPEQYDSSATSYRVGRPPLVPGSYVAGAYGPMLLPGVVSIPNWNPYSAPVSPAPSPGAQPSIGAASIYGISHSPPTFAGAFSQLPSPAGASGGIAQERKFPERNGQPDCKYYMKTGDCKYGSSCRYNHPPDWAVSKINCALSPLGLPLRPGVEACSFYMQKGHCKFGLTCKFDHPIATLRYSPASSYAEMPGRLGFSASTASLPS